MFKRTLLAILTLTQFTGCKYEELGNIFLGTVLEKRAVTEAEIIKGLKEALHKGIDQGITELGKTDGFYGSEAYKISIPDESKDMLALIIKYRGSKDIDKFVLAMNRAAEDAIPKTASIFINTLSSFSIEDGRRILLGSDTEATTLFKERTREKLISVIAPIIEESMDSAEVSKYYKGLVAIYNKLDNYISSDDILSQVLTVALKTTATEKPQIMSYEDVIEYVIRKSLDALYIKIETKEVAIRNDIKQRTTELLRRVFELQDLDENSETDLTEKEKI
jgi:hypothetical protein